MISLLPEFTIFYICDAPTIRTQGISVEAVMGGLAVVGVLTSVLGEFMDDLGLKGGDEQSWEETKDSVRISSFRIFIFIDQSILTSFVSICMSVFVFV